MEVKKDKLKNKKKDIITPETPVVNNKIETNADEKNEKNENNAELKKESESDKKVSFKEEIEVNTFIKNEPTSTTKEKKEELNEKTGQIMNSISYNIQLLLSLYNTVDDKLYTIISKYLAPDHIRNILEERDCRQICGNLICGKRVTRPSVKKFYYDAKSKDFVKDDIIDYFCDIKCFQKFKDLTKLSQKFDYLTLLRLDFLVMLSVLPEYFPDVKYIEKVAKLAQTILAEKNFSEVEILKHKQYFEKYFTEEENNNDTTTQVTDYTDQPINFI
jgi:hypothetical protein